LKVIITSLLFISILGTVLSQEFYDDDIPLVTFGLQVNTIFPSNLLRVRSNSVDVDGLNFNIDPSTGYSIGGLVSLRLSKQFFFQTGINMLRRNQIASVTADGLSESVRMRILSYELPFFISYSLRVSEFSFLNLSTGLPIQFAPTALFSTSGNIAAESLKIGVAKPVSTTMLGYEYRTLDRGAFYIGAVYTIAPWHLFLTKVTYRQMPENKEHVFRHIGDYFGIVFRYYFE
jgi:hypothetical protein